MRGTKAKRLRRAIYGEKVTSAKGRTYVRGSDGAWRCVEPERGAYQEVKREGLSYLMIVGAADDSLNGVGPRALVRRTLTPRPEAR